MLVGRAHNQRAKRPHLLVQQSDCIVLGIVGPEAVGADHLGQAVGFVRRSRVAAPAHLAQPYHEPRLGQLPRRLASG